MQCSVGQQNCKFISTVASRQVSYSGMLKDDDSMFEGFRKQGQSYL
jgi:hypothetical protein